MQLTCPTLMVTVLLGQDLAAGGRKFCAGETVKIPYGVALQAYATGLVKAFVDATETHERASKMIIEFGADAWFPANMKTLTHINVALNQTAPTTPAIH